MEMESAAWHQRQTGMVLLIVGKRHRAPYSEGHFNIPIHQGSHKMAFAIGRAMPFCTCMAHKGVDAGSQVFRQLR